MTLTIKKVPASATWQLRHQVLRPLQSIDSVRYPEDGLADARHYAIYQNEKAVAVASVYLEPEPGTNERGIWRLRGMATAPDVRGMGLGGKLLSYLLADLEAEDALYVWCNARSTVSGFYTRYGFTIESQPFDLPDIGPHVLMRHLYKKENKT